MVEKKINNTQSRFVLNCNVPQQFFEDLVEWYDDCKSIHNDNRWKKIWHDHVYVKDLKNLLINLQVELKTVRSEQKELHARIEQLLKEREEMNKSRGLMK